MTLYVSEHADAGRALRAGTMVLPTPIVSYSASSLSTCPGINANTGFLRLTADAGVLVAISSSSNPAPPLTSTNAMRIAPNAPPEYLAVPKSATTRYLISNST